MFCDSHTQHASRCHSVPFIHLHGCTSVLAVVCMSTSTQQGSSRAHSCATMHVHIGCDVQCTLGVTAWRGMMHDATSIRDKAYPPLVKHSLSQRPSLHLMRTCGNSGEETLLEYSSHTYALYTPTQWELVTMHHQAVRIKVPRLAAVAAANACTTLQGVAVTPQDCHLDACATCASSRLQQPSPSMMMVADLTE